MKHPTIYILTNKNRTTLYIGVTNNLERRMLEHKSEMGKRYNLTILLYYEQSSTMEQAIKREKQLKNWHSDWKWNLIKEISPELLDLSEAWYSKADVEEFLENQDYI